MRLFLLLTINLLGLVNSQSFSFGIGFDNASPSVASSSGFPFQDNFEPQRSQTSSRGASRSASGSASRRAPKDQKDVKQSISSFVFSGLDDIPRLTPITKQQPQIQPQSQSQQQLQPQPQIQPQPQQLSQEPQRQTQRQVTSRARQQTQDKSTTESDQQQQDQQPIRRPPSSRESQRQRTSSNQQNTENEITPLHIGKSPCARGLIGHECRLHLQRTAMACTSGKCHECQKCGSVEATDWIGCCRDHFLCCKPLARSCQRCDQPLLTPFCSVAFGKCK